MTYSRLKKIFSPPTNLFRRSGFFIFLLLILSVGLSISSIFFFPRFSVDVGDSTKYDYLATQILEHHNYPSIEGELYAPGYPLFLASIYSTLGADTENIIIIHSITLFFLSVIIFFAGQTFFQLTRSQALFPAAVIFAWPYFILYSNLVMSEILFTTLLMLAVVLYAWWQKQREKRLAIWSGAVFGLATLVRPVALLLPVWLVGGTIAYDLIKHKKNTISKTQIALFLFTFLFILLPWSIFSSVQNQQFTPVASNLPDLFNKGNITIPLDSLPENGSFLTKKIKDFFWFWNPGASGYQSSTVTDRFPLADTLIIFYKIGFFALLFLAFLALKTKNKNIFFAWFVILYFWSVHTVLFPYPRYTLPIMPIIFLLATYTVFSLYKKYERKT